MIPEKGNTCLRCHADCGEDGPRLVPYAMDVWEEDVLILGAVAGEAVWFMEAVCPDCVSEVGNPMTPPLHSPNPAHGPACGVDACLECWLESQDDKEGGTDGR